MLGPANDSPTSAVEVLKRDHDEVEALFDQYEDAKDESNAELKAQIVATLCKALSIHAQIEEEIFYPALRRRDEDAGELIDEAAVEHRTVKSLVSELQAGSPEDELYDAKVKVLSEYVKHHVREEEGEMLPLARTADLDLDALGESLLARKASLVMALESEAEGRALPRSPSRNGAPAEAPKPPGNRARSATKPQARKSAAHGGRH